MLTTLAPSQLTDPTPIVLVHGVGIGPESFSAIADELVADGRVVHIVQRPGYDRAPSAAPLLAGQVDAIVDEVLGLGTERFVWVGVSGGATLGVVALQRHPTALTAALIHEPLIGSLAPRLAESVNEGALRLAQHVGLGGALEFMEGLVGATNWASLGGAVRGQVARRRELICAEVPAFAAFEPDVDALAGHGVRVVVSVGERSPALRSEAVQHAATVLHGSVAVVAAAGHLPQLEAPHHFAALIRSLV